jgi:hypothetical protein
VPEIESIAIFSFSGRSNVSCRVGTLCGIAVAAGGVDVEGMCLSGGSRQGCGSRGECVRSISMRSA